MHGVFCCKVPSVEMIGRLPFDLSDFKHGRSVNPKRWSFEAFIRAYYGFLDQKSMFLSTHSTQEKEQNKSKKSLILQDLVSLQKLQSLIDSLLQIKPRYAAKSNIFVLEAMDCLVVECFDIYSHICNGINCILSRINSGGTTEAKIMLTILEKATDQSEKLSQYLEFCRNMGVINASGCPKLEQISEAEIQDLENFIMCASDQSETEYLLLEEEPKYVVMEEKTMTTKSHESKDSIGGLKTIITNEWEVFEEDDKKPVQELPLISFDLPMDTINNNTNPFLDHCNTFNTNPFLDHCNTNELPDLISF